MIVTIPSKRMGRWHQTGQLRMMANKPKNSNSSKTKRPKNKQLCRNSLSNRHSMSKWWISRCRMPLIKQKLALSSRCCSNRLKHSNLRQVGKWLTMNTTSTSRRKCRIGKHKLKWNKCKYKICWLNRFWPLCKGIWVWFKTEVSTRITCWQFRCCREAKFSSHRGQRASRHKAQLGLAVAKSEEYNCEAASARSTQTQWLSTNYSETRAANSLSYQVSIIRLMHPSTTIQLLL